MNPEKQFREARFTMDADYAKRLISQYTQPESLDPNGLKELLNKFQLEGLKNDRQFLDRIRLRATELKNFRLAGGIDKFTDDNITEVLKTVDQYFLTPRGPLVGQA